MNKNSISNKLALRIGIIVTLSFIILIATSVWQSISAISKATDGEFQTITEQNAQLIQNIIDSSFVTIDNIKNDILDMYEDLDNANELEYTNTSQIYNTDLPIENYLAENFMITTAINAINDLTAGISQVGVYFEPYAFDPNINIYGFHMTRQQAIDKTFTPITSYNTYQNEEFYTLARAEGTPQILQPEITDSGEVYTLITTPIIYKGEFKGMVVARMIASNFDIIKSSDDRFETMGGMILSGDLYRLYDSIDDSRLLDYFPETMSKGTQDEMYENMQHEKSFYIRGVGANGEVRMRYFSPITALNRTWWSTLLVEVTDYQKDSRTTGFLLLGIASATLAALLFVSGTLIRQMLKPIGLIVSAADEIANGKLDVTVDYQGQDEIGELAQTFTQMSKTLKGIISETSTTLDQFAKGDLNANITANYPGQFMPIKDSMVEISGTLSSTMAKINLAADQVTNGSESIAEGANALAEGATEQAHTIDDFIKNTTEIGETIGHTLTQVKSTSKLSDIAKEKAAKGTQAMTDMNESMAKINKSSLVIRDVLQTVRAIAEQTNLLALNAAIESARAGEAGRGFAVVANEIRELANKSSETVIEIEEIITQSINYIEEGQVMAGDTEKSIIEIIETVEQTADFFASLLKSTTEQQESINNLLEGTEQISEVVQSNAATAQESASVSQNLASEAEHLKSLLDYFKF
ncbi:MAG: hypothetical protein ATN35_03290 [Epulopiscium sp. Nele67-Bin004]|nr:MAG: hypothetical protein ATN35_03290 [Epulopiscium sp. Nele67-Bin004]